jgi:trk system potassium uptake protein TrkA
MYVIVAGGGKVGANLARSLVAMGHEVTLIEQKRERFERLEEEFGHLV